MGTLLQRQATIKSGSGNWLDLLTVLHRLFFHPSTASNDDIKNCHSILHKFYQSPGVFTYGAARMGLYEILKALEIGPGDEVIVPGFTCAVVVNAIRFTGATPIYADIELSTLGADTNEIQQAISSKTKAIIAHHLFGIPCDIETTLALGKKIGVPVIEDAAMAIGGKLKGRALGTFGIASILSCERTKMISTGNGGVLLVNDTGLARKIAQQYETITQRKSEYARLNLQRWALTFIFGSPMLGRIASKIIRQYRKIRVAYGRSWELTCESFDNPMYFKEYAGIRAKNYPFRLSNDQAWLLARQFRRIEDQIRCRNELAAEIERVLIGHGAGVPGIAWDRVQPSWLRYPFWVDDPGAWSARLEKLGILCSNWFEGPIHPLSCCNNPIFGYQPGSCPNGEWLGPRMLNIPLSPRFGNWLIKRIKRL